MTSNVPSEQLVLVTVPAEESIVVVPAAVQTHVGDVEKFADHCVVSTLAAGGPSHAHWFGTPPKPHTWLEAQIEVPQSMVPPHPSDITPHLPVQAVATLSGSQQTPALHT